MLQRLALAICFASSAMAFGHDLPKPADPSTKFEKLVAEGRKTIESNAQPALFFSGDVIEARSVYDRVSLWTSKTLLKVCFWNGDNAAQEAVAKSAERWNGIARMTISFSDDAGGIRQCSDVNAADIRISLVATDAKLSYEPGQARAGNWSLVGRQAEFVPNGKPAGARYAVTMNLPYTSINLQSGDLGTLDFTVGHEFGHALGMMHEFQVAKCSGWIDVKQMAKDEGWSGDAASYALDPFPSIAQKFKIDLGVSGEYDVKSIMQYNFLAKYYVHKPGRTNPCERTKDVAQPSTGDLATLVAMYGAPGTEAILSPADALATRSAEAISRLRSGLRTASGMNPGMASALAETLAHIEKLQAFEQGR